MRRRSVVAAVGAAALCAAWLLASAQARTGGADEPTMTTALPPAVLGRAGPPRGERVRYFAGDPDSLGYIAVPEGEGPHGAVLLIHEWDGLVERIMQLADALAEEGYVALAVDLFSGRTGSGPEENRALVRESLMHPEAIIDNLDAATRHLKARDDVTGKVAALGWCYGGGVALSYAVGSAYHDGTAIFYGRLLDDPDTLRHIDHELLGVFAGNDRSIPPAEVQRFVAALRAAGVPNEVHVYDGVEHGFWLYVERDEAAALAPARDAWLRLRAYLERTLR